MAEMFTHAHLEEAAAAVRQCTHHHPTVGLILGSGLSSLADAVENADVIAYEDIPHWPVSTVVGHSGRLVIGKLGGQVVVVQQGRSHFYEGYSQNQITLAVRVMHQLGIKTLVVTNAAGGINQDFNVGDLMLIHDHINFVGMAGNNPLRGPNDERIGPRFPDMTEAYDRRLRGLAQETAVSLGFSLREGVYVYLAGPTFETPAELRFLRAIGADAVGMSTVPEVVVARHAGIHVLGISTITNKAILDPSSGATVSHEEVLQTGKQIIPRLTALINHLLPKL